MSKRKRPIEDERVEAQKFSDSLDSLSETLSKTLSETLPPKTPPRRDQTTPPRCSRYSRYSTSPTSPNRLSAAGRSTSPPPVPQTPRPERVTTRRSESPEAGPSSSSQHMPLPEEMVALQNQMLVSLDAVVRSLQLEIHEKGMNLKVFFLQEHTHKKKTEN